MIASALRVVTETVFYNFARFFGTLKNLLIFNDLVLVPKNHTPIQVYSAEEQMGLRASWILLWARQKKAPA